MPRRIIRLRRARSLYAYWEGGRLVFHNFARRGTVSAKLIACELLDFFGEWQTPERAVTHFNRYTKKSLLASISHLVREGLLVSNNSPEEANDAKIAKEWSAWLPQGSFHFSTKDAGYVRDDWSLERLKAVLPKTPPPGLFKTIKGAPKTWLPPRLRRSFQSLRMIQGKESCWGEAVYRSYYRIQNRGLRFVARVSLPTGVTDSSSIEPNRVHIEQL